jgi:hypothetical protein
MGILGGAYALDLRRRLGLGGQDLRADLDLALPEQLELEGRLPKGRGRLLRLGRRLLLLRRLRLCRRLGLLSRRRRRRIRTPRQLGRTGLPPRPPGLFLGHRFLGLGRRGLGRRRLLRRLLRLSLRLSLGLRSPLLPGAAILKGVEVSLLLLGTSLLLLARL